MTAPTLSLPREARPAIELRDYQQVAFDAVLRNWRERGITRQLVSLPTGAGKTVLAAHLIGKAGLDRAVFMVHRDELVRQSVQALRDVSGIESIGVVKADRDDIYADVVVASAQTIARASRLDRLGRALAGQSVLFISDEAHHDAAPTRRNAIETIAPDLLVGLTATPKRGDGVGLDGVYEEIAAHVPMLELIALERLAPLKGLRVESAVDLDGVHTRGGEFVERELADAVNNAARNRLIVESWRKHAAGRRRTVAFCVDVAHAEALRDAFRGAGVTSEAILGSTPSDERQRLLTAFHDGHIAVLTNCMVLTEGYDEPRIDCVLMTRPTKSQALYVQCVGRAARRAPGYKDDALIIDFVDNTARHRLVSLPSLAGSESPDKEAGKDSPAAPGEEPSEADRKAGEVIDLLSLAQSKQRMREVAARHVNLFAASPFRWKPVVEGILMAPANRGQYVLLVQRGGDDGYQPLRLDMGQDGGGPSYEWLFPRALDFEMAAGIAEGKAALNQLTQRDPAWGRLPATEKQVEYARRVGVRPERGMTRGEISEAIDRARVIRAIKRLNLGGGQ
ncbi:MAG: DEAD/DEAH box helicase [Vicinamibacterales bacterium]